MPQRTRSAQQSEAQKSQAPPSEAPPSEAQPSEAQPSEVPQDEVPPSEAPPSEAQHDDSAGAGGYELPEQREPGRGRPQIAARVALLAMFALFLAGNLASGWIHLPVIAGACFLAGSLAAAWYTTRRDLLLIATTPPMIFLFAMLCAQVITAQGNTVRGSVESVAAGTFLALSAAAPWLFGGVVLTVAVTVFRGLPQCVRELQSQARGDNAPRQRSQPDQLRGTPF